ncbi:hypothetical protein [Streptomyces sp. NPDC021224]|uniref:hypothetical protein n=1 Tax=unclassified Streptomyces TaxID=2593676 RepID=UPI0037B974CF
MDSFLAEFCKELTRRWIAVLAAPGTLYLSVVATAHVLGQDHPLSPGLLAARVQDRADRAAAQTLGGQAVLLAALLVAAAAAGLVAQALAGLLERTVLAADWPGLPWPLNRLAERSTDRRRDRWNAARQRREAVLERDAERLALRLADRPTERLAAYCALQRVAAEEPERPTWSGDRLNAAAIRVQRDLGLDLADTWPYLWLTLPEDTRTQVATARQGLSRAALPGAWALLCLPLALWWWPAAPLAAVLALTGRARFRRAAEEYALILEAVTRLHAHDLAARLTPPAGPDAQQPPPPAAVPAPARRADDLAGTTD